MENGTGQLNKFNVGLAAGLTLGLYIFFIGMAAWLVDWGVETVEIIGTWYRGYDANFYGSVLGMIWGFIDGFIGGFVFAWIYNKLGR